MDFQKPVSGDTWCDKRHGIFRSAQHGMHQKGSLEQNDGLLPWISSCSTTSFPFSPSPGKRLIGSDSDGGKSFRASNRAPSPILEGTERVCIVHRMTRCNVTLTFRVPSMKVLPRYRAGVRAACSTTLSCGCIRCILGHCSRC